jgi:hypothetical protein
VSYQVTVRRGPKVEKIKRESLDEAIETLEHHARFMPRRAGVDFVNRRYEPGELVAGRIELKGSGVRAGVDVHGDGSMVAWTGRMRRAEIERRSGESAADALRRALLRA